MILLIDNYDSFTYNLVQLLREAGAEVQVVRNDAETAAGLLGRRPRGIVLSPGPGRPETAGVCVELLESRPEVPILGVCLGHQCLGSAWGATVDRAERLMHGKTSMVRYEEDPLFEGLPNPFQATRYHSLCVVEATVSGDLRPLAWSDDGILMAMRHRELPHWGVQFHPESVLTFAGVHLLRNFLGLAGVAVSADPPAPLVDPTHLAAANLATAPSGGPEPTGP
ncbi:MAG: aminodeoxychorismate/anthranilate synthase component II [Holophagales bacterium]|nr:aminodeoxychorismate/anthranilate synthase component II [Holophagales bacterium]